MGNTSSNKTQTLTKTLNMPIFLIKDTHMRNTSTNKTQAPTKNFNMDIWEIAALNQLFKKGSYTKINSKN